MERKIKCAVFDLDGTIVNTIDDLGNTCNFLIEKYGESLRFITLEVRPSNIAAVKLYTSLGFNKVGERPSYYSNPVENAILLTKNLNSNLEI